MRRLPQPNGGKGKLKVREDGKARVKEKYDVNSLVLRIEVVIETLAGAQQCAALGRLASRDWTHRTDRERRKGYLSM